VSIFLGAPKMAIADDRSKAVELALAQIEKQFGKGSIVRLGSKEAMVPIAVISTGSISSTRRWAWVESRAAASARSSARVLGQDDDLLADHRRGTEGRRPGRIC